MRLFVSLRTDAEIIVPARRAVPGNKVANSDILKALSEAVASSVGKPEQVRRGYDICLHA